MIWIILVICVLVAVGCFVWSEKSYNNEIAGSVLGVIASIGACISIIGSLVLIGDVVNLRVLDNQIAMYQEENEKIEDQIGAMVMQYQEYETEIFTDIKPESSITLVSLYPELKSDTLVQEQIKIHTANNQKIKELKEKKINGSVYRWWLYFGN